MGMGGQHYVPAALPPGMTRYPLYRRLGGLPGRSGRVRKISAPPGFDLRTVQPVASRFTDWDIPAHVLCEVGTKCWNIQTLSDFRNTIVRSGKCGESANWSKLALNIHTVKYTCAQMGFQLKSKLQHTWMWWPSCRLCYHPTIFFCRLLLTALWFQKEKFWRDFYLSLLPAQNFICWVVSVIWMNYRPRRGSGVWSPASCQVSQNSIPDQPVCDLWLAEWQGIRFCSQ